MLLYPKEPPQLWLRVGPQSYQVAQTGVFMLLCLIEPLNRGVYAAVLSDEQNSCVHTRRTIIYITPSYMGGCSCSDWTVGLLFIPMADPCWQITFHCVKTTLRTVLPDEDPAQYTRFQQKVLASSQRKLGSADTRAEYFVEVFLCMRGQMGDYNASSFYRFAKRGHRFKCWECGVKKKAPCGEVDRADLPWCCHRRLGAYLPLLSASQVAATDPHTISIQSAPHLRMMPVGLTNGVGVFILPLSRLEQHLGAYCTFGHPDNPVPSAFYGVCLAFRIATGR